jgi:hypothetical protein
VARGRRRLGDCAPVNTRGGSGGSLRSGWLLPGLCVLAGGIGAIAAVATTLAADTGNKDHYGRVPIPGVREIELPKGDVSVNYEERIDLGGDENLDVPANLQIAVLPRGGARALPLDEPSPAEEYHRTNRAGRSVGLLRVPKAGRYLVRAGGRGKNRSSFALGKKPNYVPGLLIAAGALALGLVAALVVVRVRRFRRTFHPRGGPPQTPTGMGGTNPFDAG